MTLPAWLQRTIGDTYRTVRLRTCPHCRTPVLAGLDADICAFSVRADLMPLTTFGEALALLAGRRTFDLIGGTQAKRLDIREEHNIRARRRYPVLPEHRCGQGLAAHCEPSPPQARRPIPEVPQF